MTVITQRDKDPIDASYPRMLEGGTQPNLAKRTPHRWVMFEIFHDVQYLAIVWIYNRRRLITNRAALGGISRLLFGSGATRIPLYVGLVLAYGAISFVGKGVLSGDLQRALVTRVAASSFLHFYYGSFIWNLRDESTRRDLDIDPGAAPVAPRPAAPAWLGRDADVAGVLQRLAELDPGSGSIRFQLALALYKAGLLEQAEEAYRYVLRLDPEHIWAHTNLGTLLLRRGDLAGARQHTERALPSP